MKLNIAIIISIIITSALIGLAYNYINPKGLALIRNERIIDWVTDSSAVHQSNNNYNSSDHTHSNDLSGKITNDNPDNFSEPKAIKIDFAYKLFQEGKKFVDARPVEEYEENHIKGAINIPFYGSENYESVLNKISKDEIIITYCSGDDCDLSILLGDELFAKGYKKIYIFFGGWNDWLKMGYPTEK